MVLPIKKEGDQKEANNIRPFYYPSCQKYVKGLHLNYALHHAKQKIIYKTRWTIKTLHSMETSLLITADAILSTINDKKTTAVVLLGMS